MVAYLTVTLPMDRPSKTNPLELLKRAAFNQYNAIALGGVGLFAAATASWLPLVVGAGAEVLWLVLGSDSSAFARWVEAQKTREAREELTRETERMLKNLGKQYHGRFGALKQASDEIEKLAHDNKDLATSLLKDEMAKLGQLLYSFLKMATVHQRLSRYLSETRGAQIQEDIDACQRGMANEKDPRVQASLKQAHSLAQKRLRQFQQIEGAYKALSVQMFTLEKAFDYLKSNILGIGTREQLAQELDSLVSGVASVAELEACGVDFLDDARPSMTAGNVVKLASKR